MFIPPSPFQVWLPGFEPVNLYALPSERNARYGIFADARTVSYWISLHGIFYVPMTFDDFPFDKQNLFVSLMYDWGNGDLDIIPSGAAMRIFTQVQGDDVPTWHIDDVSLSVVSTQLRDDFAQRITHFSHADEPAPMCVPRCRLASLLPIEGITSPPGRPGNGPLSPSPRVCAARIAASSPGIIPPASLASLRRSSGPINNDA